MRGLILLLILFIGGCTASDSDCNCRRDMLADRESYLDYRLQDFGLPMEELDSMELVWEREWFDGLADDQQVFLIDSIGGFEHLRDYCLICRPEDFFVK